ncbi:hypothetical protein ABPG74_005084 [Tetrahymena malaccensis]
MGLKRFVKKLDIFGKPVQLRLEKRKAHKTLCGGIVTLLIIISVVLITIYYGLKLYYKQNPSIDQMTTINSTQSIQAQSYEFGFAVNIFSRDDLNQNSQGVFQINEQIFSNQSSTLINKGFNIKAYYSNRIKISENDYEENQIEIPLMPCSKNEQFIKYWASIFALPDNKKDEYLCPFFQDSLKDAITIQGGITQDQAKQISIVVEIQDEIKSNKNWKDMLTNSLVVLKVYDEMAFLESFENPVQRYSRTIIDWIDLDKIKFIQLKHNQQVISTDKGIYFSDNQDQYLKQISDICYFYKKNDLSSNSKVLNIITQVNQTKQVFLRSYFKASVMLAYIGGFLQLTLIFGKSITKPFSKLSFYTSLVNEVFQFEDDKQKNQQEEQKLNDTEQKPFQQSTYIQQTTMIDETGNKNLNQTILKSRSLFYPSSQKKDSIDTSQEIIQQAQEQVTSPNILHIKNSRNSYLQSKNIEDENAKKTQGTDSKKNSLYSMQISDLNTPIQIKKKSLFKNQNLLQNFREYFEADRLEKRLIISAKIVLVEFFQKLWIFIKLICSKDKVKNDKQFYTAIEKLKFSKNKVNERLDIIYIVQKLQEIDKLKQIVLDKNQRKLFEYLPRPVLKNEYIFQKAPIQKMKSYSKTQEWSILKQEESIQQKAIKAWIAFTEISNKECLERKDRKVIRLLDVKAKNIFEITSKKIHDEIFDQQQNNIKIKALCNAYGQNYQANESSNISRKSSLQVFGQRKSKNLIQFINVQTSGKRNSLTKSSIKKKASLKDLQTEQVISANFLDQTYKSSEFQDIQQKFQSQTINQIKESKSVTHASQQSSESSFSSSDSSSNSDLSESSVQCQSQLDTVYQNKHATIKQTNFKEQSEFQKQNNLKIELNEIPENIEKSCRYSQDNTVNKSSVEQNSYLNDNSNKDKKQTQYIQSFQANISQDQGKVNISNYQSQDFNPKDIVKRGSQTEKFQDKKFNLFNAYFNQVKNQDDLYIEQIKLKNLQQEEPLNLQSFGQQGQINNLLASQKSPTTPQMQNPLYEFKKEDGNLQNQNNEVRSNDQNVEQYKSFIKKRNHILNHQQFTTPQYLQKRKNQKDYSDIYNSASFTQFMKKITPIIAKNKVENSDA